MKDVKRKTKRFKNERKFDDAKERRFARRLRKVTADARVGFERHTHTRPH